ncbi:MAG: T9SS type A sorting domain-containing protein [Bacteroidia bacterium]|jgi:hypothetical protein|nr:T9SS type A sorting domain-containing protein [Bacteroidia bacterium]
MKKYLLLISVCCLVRLAAMAQTTEENTPENTPHNGQGPCERITPIVTNPFAPQNTEWFTMRNRFNWMDYITQFGNWKGRIRYFDNNNFYNQGQLTELYFINPYFDDEPFLSHVNLKDNFNLLLFLNSQTDFSNVHRLTEEMDITSFEHGWELLWKYDGYESDGTTPVRGAMASINTPANFILYNRYTGMLRWFFAPRVVGNNYNELESVIEFSDRNQVASLFRNYNGLDQALDKPTIVLRTASPSQTTYRIEHFSMADFNISYDPCVCYFESRLDFKLNGIKSANINLYRRLEGTSQMLSARDAINTDRLLSLFKNEQSNFPNEVKNGLLEYKNYGQMERDFSKLAGKSNIFDDVNDASKVVADVAQFGVDFVLSTKKPWKSLKTLSKFVGFASMPFKSDKKTKSPPMLIQAQMTLTGQLTSSTALNGFTFNMFTPGSYKTDLDYTKLNSLTNNERFSYPVYNQALGLYAMLKTPQKEIARHNEKEEPISITLIRERQTDYNTFHYDTVGAYTNSFTYSPGELLKLNHQLSFTFNPSAKINREATTMDAAWIVEVEGYEKLFYGNTGDWEVNSKNLKKAYSYRGQFGQIITVFMSEFMPIECFSAFLADMQFTLKESAKNIMLKDRTYSIKLSDLPSRLEDIFSDLRRSKPRIVSTYLKKNIVYRFNKPDMSGLNDIVHFETRTFEVEGNGINQNLLLSPDFEVLSSPDERVIENRHFTANETIFAWEEITIKGKISCDPGVEVIILAGKEIIVEEGAEISPTVSLKIGLPSSCSQTKIQPTTIDATFCNNANKYKANQAAKKDNSVELKQNESINKNITMIYPNPASDGHVLVETTLENDSYINISVFDLTGKLIGELSSDNILTKGKHQSNLSNLSLGKGVYIIKVETNQGVSTHRLMMN